MIMIPLHYLIGVSALAFAFMQVFDRPEGARNRMFIAFLVMLAGQAIIVGTRFGYGVEWLREVQPVTAAMLPPMAYLSFRESSNWRGYAPHLLAPLLATLTVLTVNDLLDAVLAINNLVYGYLLVRLGLKGGDGLPWAGINHLRNWQITLWVIVALLVYSGVTDSVVSIDYLTTRGENTDNIIAIASVIGLAGTIAAGVWVRFRSRRPVSTQGGDHETVDPALFERIDSFLRSERLYLDPDINLNRIARRLALPAREVSRAINSGSNQNVSQYVNTLRIEEACRMISETGNSITSVIYGSGFNTKSNFNREFLRVTGMTPSEWRSAVPGNPDQG